ncbi:unnamed protein product [[Candida] boidinii]|nr:unnamed protein product [[Candida] boidinii]
MTTESKGLNKKFTEEASYAPSFEDVNNDNDELAELRGEGRYFGVADPDLAQPVCSNCHRRGHIRSKCKVVVCHACGVVDDHYETQCPVSMVCNNCGERGHFQSQCTKDRKRTYCSDCDSRNHSNDRCPNIWRSYLTIVVDDNSKKNYPFGSVYCYNCGSKGHYGDECNSVRSSRTPNINGSAFTGDNLPKELRSQYFSLLARSHRYGNDDDGNDYEDDSYNSGGYYNRASSAVQQAIIVIRDQRIMVVVTTITQNLQIQVS